MTTDPPDKMEPLTERQLLALKSWICGSTIDAAGMARRLFNGHELSAGDVESLAEVAGIRRCGECRFWLDVIQFGADSTGGMCNECFAEGVDAGG